MRTANRDDICRKRSVVVRANRRYYTYAYLYATTSMESPLDAVAALGGGRDKLGICPGPPLSEKPGL